MDWSSGENKTKIFTNVSLCNGKYYIFIYKWLHTFVFIKDQCRIYQKSGSSYDNCFSDTGLEFIGILSRQDSSENPFLDVWQEIIYDKGNNIFLIT